MIDTYIKKIASITKRGDAREESYYPAFAELLEWFSEIPLDLDDRVPRTMIKKRTKMKDYVGTWKITEMDQWDMDYIDMESPGCVVIDRNGQGEIHFGAVEVGIDCRLEPCGESVRLGFSFEGNDECDPVSGRGWALADGEEMTGHIFFHLGDDSKFKAKRRNTKLLTKG